MTNRKFRWKLPAALRLAALAALCAGSVSAAQAQVAVSVGVPGVFGHIDIGDAPRPQVIYDQPVVVERGPTFVAEPEYLHVPAGQERDWKRYCAQYSACGRPVYFVKDDWYHREYEPRHRVARGDEHRGPPPGRDERRDERHDDDHHEAHGRS